jgi:hypothetical protein
MPATFEIINPRDETSPDAALGLQFVKSIRGSLGHEYERKTRHFIAPTYFHFAPVTDLQVAAVSEAINPRGDATVGRENGESFH